MLDRIPLLRSTLDAKRVMALTGAWLCLFLAVHTAGNLTLFLPADEARPIFNGYTAFMTSHPLVGLISLVNYAMFGLHSAVALALGMRNRRARGTGYVCERPGLTSPWHARRMGLLGCLVLAFLVLHLQNFWYRYHYGAVPLDDEGLRDLYGVVQVAFSNVWLVGVYVAAMAVLGLHLLHGVHSATRTLGLHHRRYGRLAHFAAIGFSVAVAGAFAAMPPFLHLFRAP